MFKNKNTIKTEIQQSMECTMRQDMSGAVEHLENAYKIMKKKPALMKEFWSSVLWPLGNMYGAMQKYEEALEVQQQEILLLIEKYGVTDIGAVNLLPEDANRAASLFLCMGAAYMNLNKPEEARKQHVLGYTLAFRHFGEFDERTLKQLYNLACCDLKEDEQEGLRQLRYCYYDMREHLGEKNACTQKAKEVLIQFGDKPEKDYKNHIKMKEYVRKEGAAAKCV